MTKVLTLLLAACTLLACQKPNTIESSTSATPKAAPKNMGYGGIALYSLRDTMGVNPKGTLQAVAKLGYAYVEAAGYDNGKFYGMTPVEFKRTLTELGLQPMSSHMGMVTVDNADRLIADVKAAGFKYFVIPVPPMGAFGFDSKTMTMNMSQDAATVMANLNAIADKCAAAGLKCLYHNHDFEFKAGADGIVPIDYFLENSDPDKLNFQMDLYWVTKAGADPVAYFERYPGRWKSWHVKDMDAQGRFAPVGEGSIDFNRVVAKKELAGMEFYCVEQDMTFDGQRPLQAIGISHAALKEIGLGKGK